MLDKKIITDQDFATLRLSRDSRTGDIRFYRQAIADICLANNINPDDVLSNEDDTAEFIAAWYAAHRLAGGVPDSVQEDILSEIQAEDSTGGGLSHKPGQA